MAKENVHAQAMESLHRVVVADPRPKPPHPFHDRSEIHCHALRDLDTEISGFSKFSNDS